MNQLPLKKSPRQMVDAIFALDLDLVRLKLMDKTEGHGWTPRQAAQNELEYRRFLVLLAKYPDQPMAPPTEVHKFWHGHILDTMKYAEDCNNIFGYFMHHVPYVGMRGEEDAASLVSAFMNMQRLYDLEFGDGRRNGTDSGSAALPCAVSKEPVQNNAAWRAAPFSAPANRAAKRAALSGKSLQARDNNAAWCAPTRTGAIFNASACVPPESASAAEIRR